MSVEVQVHTVPHFKGLIRGIEDIGLLCESTFILCSSFLKTAILLHKQGFVKTGVVSTVLLVANV